jgi:hypothetical protein
MKERGIKVSRKVPKVVVFKVVVVITAPGWACAFLGMMYLEGRKGLKEERMDGWTDGRMNIKDKRRVSRKDEK